MAKTKSGKKIVCVGAHSRGGSAVRAHRRSTPTRKK